MHMFRLTVWQRIRFGFLIIEYDNLNFMLCVLPLMTQCNFLFD
jgi:hypothetical protein